MSFTYDLSSNVGKMRMMIPDRHADEAFFTDEELSAFLEMEGDVKRGTALALETMASDQAMVLKVVRLLDVSTDGRAVAESLMKRASELRRQADEADQATSGGFEIAEMVVDDFSFRRRMENEALRNG